VTLDLSASSVIDASSGVILLALGVVIAWLGRRTPLGLPLAGTAAFFGLDFITTNIWRQDDGQPYGFFLNLASLIALPSFAVALSWRLSRGFDRDLARWHKAILGLGVLVLAIFDLVGAPSVNADVAAFGYPPTHAWAELWLLIGIGRPIGLGIIVATAALASQQASRRGDDPRVFSVVALGFGSYLMWSSSPAVLVAYAAPGLMWASIALSTATAAASLSWLLAIRPPRGAWARNTALALLAVGLMGMIWSIAVGALSGALGGGNDYGGPGIIRTIGAIFLALAVFRHGLLGTRLPRIIEARGLSAATALVTLFVVAQVAQNFFAAQYGLLLGGVIAG
jgi:hypothetical protein